MRFYSASGQLLATDSTSLDLKSQYMIVTENTMQYFVDNAPLNPVSTYTRGQDNVLHFDGGRTLDLNTHLVNGRLILDSNGIRVPVSSSPIPQATAVEVDQTYTR
ncbi:hypothetical protein DNI29_21210 [Hymenobacter sediminis]|uniref:hypothetical protein n=1 Tax=Hymenobacter sediminis TaxID=2218621 RepID=UPI000DA6DAE7|nr:hypothetical protein [Hymenobacter sediminis]RPD44650.1 hypothetical protein DNI29_21210 [Hymenobacter sediminis]